VAKKVFFLTTTARRHDGGGVFLSADDRRFGKQAFESALICDVRRKPSPLFDRVADYFWIGDNLKSGLVGLEAR
jgi:hypothetical protein